MGIGAINGFHEKAVELLEKSAVESAYIERSNMKDITLGEAIDRLHALQKDREIRQREFDAMLAGMKQKESELEQHILLVLQKEKMSGSRGTTAQVSVRPKTVPQVRDWIALFNYIRERNAFELLQKRIGATAWKEHVEAGEVIPGVESETYSVLSVTKIA